MSSNRKITILGAGLSGISASYHLGHENCILFEKSHFKGGHIHSYNFHGFTWDEGPHVSFTRNDYVRDLFYENVKGNFLEYAVETSNYFQSHWIPHPAQSNLYKVPQPLRGAVLKSFLESRKNSEGTPANYEEWLIMAFGKTFYENFPMLYTKKYWTKHPKELTTDWVGKRVFYPNIDDVKRGFYNPLPNQTHYITEVRYPIEGGYFKFAEKLYEDANIQFEHEIDNICFDEKRIDFKNGTSHFYHQLITTIPLPKFIECSNAPENIKSCAHGLECSSLLLVNIVTNHPAVRKEKWMYVYDEDKYTTRLYYTEGLSPKNGQPGKSGIQVEVYFSQSKPKVETDETIAKKVVEELIEMKLIKDQDSVENIHTRWVPYANVIFDHKRREAQETIFEWLEKYGLVREEDDLEPMTNWEFKENENLKFGDIILAGRFGQWKYFWTDDCVLRGKFIRKNLI